jgi:hypothetical protein
MIRNRLGLLIFGALVIAAPASTQCRPVASGTYFAKLESAGQVQVQKVVVAR